MLQFSRFQLSNSCCKEHMYMIPTRLTTYRIKSILIHYRQRCRSETEKNILEDLSSSVLLQFEKYHPSGNLKFNNLGIFQS